MQNHTLLERIDYMHAVMSVLSEEISSLHMEADIEEDNEDLILAHLLQDKTANLGFLLLDIIKEELDEITEEALAEKDYSHPLFEDAGTLDTGESTQAKDWDTTILPMINN